MIHVVLLSGGSGSRLWPLSNNARSKQFLKVLRDENGNHVSMVQRVFGQIARVPAQLDVTVATSQAQRDSLRSQIPDGYSLVLEPERRDTAPAIMLACEHLRLVQGADAGDTVVVMPIDTYADQEYYDSIARLDSAVQERAAQLVLLGVKPTFPSTKYGYIVPVAGTESQDAPRPVSRFTEKPDAQAATRLMNQGALWNCGVFAFRLGWLLKIASSYLDATTFDEYLENYSRLPKNSFDYEVVENTDSISVIPYQGEWKDLGTWNTLTDEMSEAVSGRAAMDESTCDNVHVINETNLPMVVSGLHDAVVVATPDGILACGKQESAGIKPLVESVASKRPMYETRRWGEYRVLDTGAYADGNQSLTKELVIQPGKQISYQRHQHRSEIWTVVSGEGEAVIDGQVRTIRPGDVVSAERGHMHAMRGISELHVIEVQLGDDLVEEDIERFGNYWESDR